MKTLPGDYVAGFVDGEGCFALKFRKETRNDRKNKPTYYYWDVEFAILLRADDRPLLERILTTLRCGRISINKRGAARYAVNNIDELADVVIPYFGQYQLIGKKKQDFKLWKEAVGIVRKNRGLKTNISSTGNPRGAKHDSWKPEDLQRLEKIYLSMREFKSKVPAWKWIAKNKQLS